MMQVLTPTGYQSPVELAHGAQVCAFELSTGAAILNTIETIEAVDYTEWCRWWQEEVPAFNWVRLNGVYLVFGEQRIWRHGLEVCLARELMLGDVIHDENDRDVTITSVELFEDHSLVWYRFEISGDHSYIVDGLTVHNASVFWVGGTGTWDASTTTNWSASSGGAGGAAVPGSADSAIFDGSSGAGTVTLNFGGTITLAGLAMSAYAGTWDNSVNNNNITISGGNNAFNVTGTTVKTVKLGSATYTLSSTSSGAILANFTGSANLTLVSGSETIVYSGVSQNIRHFQSGKSHGALTLNANCGNIIVDGATNNPSFTTLTLNGGANFLPNSSPTVTSIVTVGGSSGKQIGIMSGSGTGPSNQVSISCASGTQNLAWCAIKDIAFSGGATFAAANSFDLGDNTGITITTPSSGGGGGTRFSATIF